MSYDDYNNAAEFLPKTGAFEVPALQVAGAMVSVYIDRSGTLTVSVDLDEADQAIQTPRETVPMRITVQGETVFTGS